MGPAEAAVFVAKEILSQNSVTTHGSRKWQVVKSEVRSLQQHSFILSWFMHLINILSTKQHGYFISMYSYRQSETKVVRIKSMVYDTGHNKR